MFESSPTTVFPMKRLGFILLPLALMAASTQACDLQIDQGWVRSAPPGASVLAGYGVLRNHGAQPIAVSSISSAQFGAIEIHESSEQDGVARMRRIDRLEIPANGEVRLEPSGKHLMLMQPKAELVVGSKVELLVADCDPALRVELPVREGPAEAEHSHEHHHH